MPDQSVYAVFLHPQAVEALGPAITPYLSDSPAGPHLQCVEIDSGGSLFEMTLVGKGSDGRIVEVELMLPVAMVRLVISVKRDGEFGFGPRAAPEGAAAVPGAGPAPSTVAPGAAAT